MGGRPAIPRVYAYLACLVALITALICLGTMVSAAFDLSDPLHARGDLYAVRMLSSLENFRIETLARLPEGQDPPDERALQAMYDASRGATLRAVRLQSLRTLTASGLVLVISVAIFFGHLRWVRRLDAEKGPLEGADGPAPAPGLSATSRERSVA
jgi:hypothetical protein